jgi:hypothetical protein
VCLAPEEQNVYSYSDQKPVLAPEERNRTMSGSLFISLLTELALYLTGLFSINIHSSGIS